MTTDETLTADRPDLQLDPEAIRDNLTAAGLPVVHAPSRAFMPVTEDQLTSIGRIMAFGGPMVPAQFQAEIVGEAKAIGRCKAVAYQAARWGLDPIAVCQKAYVTVSAVKDKDGRAILGEDNKPLKAERIGYEAQLVHALVLAFAPIVGRPVITYGYGDPAKRVASQRFCRIEVTTKSGERLVHTSPTVSQIGVKNSPLWVSDPDQQLAYYTSRAMARRHFPDVLMGVYTRDELQLVEARDISPRAPMFPAADPVEIQDAEYEGIPATADNESAFGRWLAKASGEGDSRDPRDAEVNQEASAPSPDHDAAELRDWAGAEQLRMLALEDADELKAQWLLFAADKRAGRLRAYQQPVFNAIRNAIVKRGDQLLAAKTAGADPATGEVK